MEYLLQIWEEDTDGRWKAHRISSEIKWVNWEIQSMIPIWFLKECALDDCEGQDIEQDLGLMQCIIV